MSENRYTLDTWTVMPVDRAVTRLLYVSAARYSAEWHSTLHTHPCTEVFFVTGGRGYLQMADRVIHLNVGDVIVVNPNTEHTEVSSEEGPLEYIVMGVDGMEALAEEETSGGCSVLHFQNEQDTLRFCMRNMLRELETRLPGYDTICQDLLEIVLLHLVRRSEFTVTFVPSIRKSSKECALVRRYIDNHFKEDLTLDGLAAVAHVSKYYLVHSFTKEYGTSPINYLLSCRIKESLHLLSETRMPLSQIAELLGFSSPSYFSQSFRRIQGTSPMEYRKQSKNGQKT